MYWTSTLQNLQVQDRLEPTFINSLQVSHQLKMIKLIDHTYPSNSLFDLIPPKLIIRTHLTLFLISFLPISSEMGQYLQEQRCGNVCKQSSSFRRSGVWLVGQSAKLYLLLLGSVPGFICTYGIIRMRCLFFLSELNAWLTRSARQYSVQRGTHVYFLFAMASKCLWCIYPYFYFTIIYFNLTKSFTLSSLMFALVADNDVSTSSLIFEVVVCFFYF